MRRTLSTAARLAAVLVAALGLLLAFAVPSSAAGTNDYPYRYQTNTKAIDKWGFTQRQCVSFVAWRMAQAGRPVSYVQGYRSALNWDEVARSKGKRITATPRVGAVVHWNPTERSLGYFNGSTRPNGYFTAGSYGHVATVLAVHWDGSVTVEQYNMNGTRSYSKLRIKRLSSGPTHRYIYL